MVSSFSKRTDTHFNEVAIANLGEFQVAVLTRKQPTSLSSLLELKIRPQRQYQGQGWLIWNDQTIACLSGFEIGSLDTEDAAFRLPKRLAPSVPISFEAQSRYPLPITILDGALMACELPNTPTPFRTLFRNIVPRFVRIYPFDIRMSLLANVRQMKMDEAEFIAQNREQLKGLPFYQDYFDL
ncbi:MAG: hypothetical protein AAFX78_13795 [Cyanobacteria bacterium J06638_20]